MATEWRAIAKDLPRDSRGLVVLFRNSWVIHGNGTVFDIIPPDPKCQESRRVSTLFAIQSGEVTVSLYFLLFFPSDIRPRAPLRALSRLGVRGAKMSLTMRCRDWKPAPLGL